MCWAYRARARQEGVRGARGRGEQASGTAWARGALAGAAGREGAQEWAVVTRGRAERARVSVTVAATRPCWPATRPGQGPRYGHCARLGVPVRAWVCSAGPDLGFVHFDSVFGPV